MCMYEFMQKLFNLNRDLDNDASFIKTNVLIWNFVTQTLHVPWIGPSVSILCEDHPRLKFPPPLPSCLSIPPIKTGKDRMFQWIFLDISVYIRGGVRGASFRRSGPLLIRLSIRITGLSTRTEGKILKKDSLID